MWASLAQHNQPATNDLYEHSPAMDRYSSATAGGPFGPSDASMAPAAGAEGATPDWSPEKAASAAERNAVFPTPSHARAAAQLTAVHGRGLSPDGGGMPAAGRGKAGMLPALKSSCCDEEVEYVPLSQRLQRLQDDWQKAQDTVDDLAGQVGTSPLHNCTTQSLTVA